jgi:hypothetical protein
MYIVSVNGQNAVNYAMGQAGISVHVPPPKVCICDIHMFYNDG